MYKLCLDLGSHTDTNTYLWNKTKCDYNWSSLYVRLYILNMYIYDKPIVESQSHIITLLIYGIIIYIDIYLVDDNVE